MRVNSAWTKAKNEEEKKYIIDKLKNNVLLFEQLVTILNSRRRELTKESYDYDNPSWAYKQAHVNGYKECLDWIESLLPKNEDQTK